MAKKASLASYGVMDNKNVLTGYQYWVNYLLDMTSDLFQWEGLPSSLPSQEIEKRLVRDGFSIIFKHPKFDVIACNGNLYNYDVYGRYAQYNVANPAVGFYQGFSASGKTIGVDGVVVYNTGNEKYINSQTQDNLFYTTVMRYARMLADIESTLSTELIDARMPYMPVATSQQNYNSVLNVLKKLELGEMEVAVDGDFLQDLKVLKKKDHDSQSIGELINNRRNILSMFYAEVGMYQPDSKRERLLVDEVENGQNNEKTLIYSMLRERMIGAKAMSEFFGTSITVGLREVLYNKEIPINIMDLVDGGVE